MKIYPAVDVLGGKAVRLLQGDYDKATVFNESPVDAAKKWTEYGSSLLHIVDLDGARYGKSYITNIIREIKAECSVMLQTGGGVRRLEDVTERIEAGADRVIIGTAAITDPDLVKNACNLYGDKIAVGIDAKNGLVAINGWKEVSDIRAVDLALKMKEFGVGVIIYTDISKDGMMCGPNISSTRELIEKTGLKVIASGGVSAIKDIDDCAEAGAYGIIIGKALYNGSLDLKNILNKYKG